MEWINLNKLCKIIGGKPNPKDDIAFDVEGIPFVRMRDLGKYHLSTNLTSVETFINEEYAKKYGYKVIEKGAILIPRSGSVSLNHRAILGVDAAIVSHICALEIFNQKIDNYYLYYYLTMLDMGRIAQKTTGLDSISFKRLGMIKIPVRPRIEQSKIVAYLNKIQELIDRRKEVVELLDKYIKSVFLEMFFEDVDREKWQDEKINKLKVIKKTTYGTATKANVDGVGIPVLRMNNISYQGEISLDNLKWADLSKEESGKLHLKDGHVLFNRTNSPDLVGKMAVWDKGDGYTFAGYLIRLEINEEKLSPYYLSSYFNSEHGKKILYNKARLSGNLANISASTLMEQRLLLPPINMQKEYEDIYTRVQVLKNKYLQSLNFLDVLFKSALQDAFNENEKIEERTVFEELIKKFSLADLKKQNRPEILIDWINKNKQQFSNFDNYDMAWKKLIELLEGGTIEQVLEGNEIKLKGKK